MSARAIVSLGIWVLFMVLVGTMTVGITVAFYVFMAISVGVAVVLLIVLKRRPPDSRQT